MIAFLVEAAARGLLLAVVTALLLALLRVKNIPAQRTAWILVLLASIAMPALMRSPWVPSRLNWTPRLPIHQPEQPQPSVARTQSASSTVAPVHVSEVAAPTDTTYAPGLISPSTTPQPAPPASPSRWLLILYVSVSATLLVRLLIGLATATRLWSRAIELPQFAEPNFQVRATDAVASPVTVASGVLLPANYRSWDTEKLRIVLAHERSHVRHFDFHLQFLAGLYTAIFWFSPLGWWLRRRLSSLGEAISDRAGLTEASTRTNYAEIVLQFAAMPRRPMTGVAMASSGNISRRIEQLLNTEAHRIAFTEGRYRARLAFLLLPCVIFVAAMFARVPAAQARPQQSVTEIVQNSEPAPPAPESNSAAAPAMPAPAPEPSAAAEPAPAPAEQDTVTIHRSSTNDKGHSESHGYSYGFSDGGDSFALVNGPDTNMTISGNWSDTDMKAEIDKARRQTSGAFLWFRRDGKSYLLTDPATIARIQAMYKPMEELGRQQEELGKKQEKLGEEQERLGNLQEKASVQAPDLSRELAELSEATAKLNAAKGKELTQEQISELEEKIGDLQGKLGELQGKIGEKQGSFGAEQGRLGAEQGKLGEQQGKLGEQQGKLAREADRQVHAIINQSLSSGKAHQLQ